MAATRRVVVPYFFLFPPHESPGARRRRAAPAQPEPCGGASRHADAEQTIDARVARRPPSSRWRGSSPPRPGTATSTCGRTWTARCATSSWSSGSATASIPAWRSRAPASGLGSPARASASRPTGRSRSDPTVIPTDETGVAPSVLLRARPAPSRPSPAVDVLTGSSPPPVQGPHRSRRLHRPRPHGRAPDPLRRGHAGRREPRHRAWPISWRGGDSSSSPDSRSSRRSRCSSWRSSGRCCSRASAPIWGTVVAVSLAVATTGLVHWASVGGSLGLPASPAGGPRRRPRRERPIPGVNERARAPVDQEGVPPVRATGGRGADRAGPLESSPSAANAASLTVLFSDIRGFTTFSELHPAGGSGGLHSAST